MRCAAPALALSSAKGPSQLTIQMRAKPGCDATPDRLDLQFRRGLTRYRKRPRRTNRAHLTPDRIYWLPETPSDGPPKQWRPYHKLVRTIIERSGNESARHELVSKKS